MAKILVSGKRLTEKLISLRKDLTAMGESAPVSAFVDLANLQIREQIYEDAKDTIENGLRLYPNNIELFQIKAEYHFKMKSWKESSVYWKTVVELNDDLTLGELLRYVIALRKSQQLVHAEEVILRLIKDFSTEKDVWREAAYVSMDSEEWLLSEGRWIQYFELLGKRKKNQELAFIGYITTLQKLKKYDLAGSMIANELKKYPSSHRLLNAQACLEVERMKNNETQKNIIIHEVKQDLNVATVCECFWYAERKLDLLNWKVNGVYVWPLIRIQLYYSIAQQIGLYDAPHPVQKNKTKVYADDVLTKKLIASIKNNHINVAKSKSKKKLLLKKFKFKLNKAWSLLVRRQPLMREPAPVILMATRKLNGVEPYTEALRCELEDDALLLDRPFGDSQIMGSINFDALVREFRNIFKDPMDSVLSITDRLVCEEVRKIFLTKLGNELSDLEIKCQTAISTFKSVRRGFQALWKILPVDTLYLTNGYGITTRATMAAAREAGARIVELQHGFISKFHLGYSWPSRPDVPYSPDELWCFGPYWSEVTPLALNVSARSIGAPYVKKLAEQTKSMRQQDLILFTSQGVIGQRLFEWAFEVARHCPEKKIIFRLHPSEVIEDYQELASKLECLPENFSISHREPVIFELLAQSSIQVGAFSTTLLEGMVLGTRTIVVELPGVEYMQPVIDRGDAILVKSIDELIARLDDAPKAHDSHHYYANSVFPLVANSTEADEKI